MPSLELPLVPHRAVRAHSVASGIICGPWIADSRRRISTRDGRTRANGVELLLPHRHVRESLIPGRIPRREQLGYRVGVELATATTLIPTSEWQHEAGAPRQQLISVLRHRTGLPARPPGAPTPVSLANLNRFSAIHIESPPPRRAHPSIDPAARSRRVLPTNGFAYRLPS